MTLPVRLSRRSLTLGLGLTLARAALAPEAWAMPALAFPLRIAYARIGREGFMRLTSDDQAIWTALQLRTGGLIDEIEPIQPRDMLGAKTPELDGGASCAMVARQIAANGGYTHALLYATDDGKQTHTSTHTWMTKAFATVTSEYFDYDSATGEAHLLDIGGGPAIASVSADARKAEPLETLQGRKPERDALLSVATAMERKLQLIARGQYELQRSRAD